MKEMKKADPCFAVAASVRLLFETFEELALLDLQQTLVYLAFLFKMLLGFSRLIVVLWVIQHGGAQTVLSFLHHQDLVIDAAFAAGPELLVLCQFGISNRLVAKVAVDLHDSQAGSEAKDLGFGILFPAEGKNPLFDGFGHTAFFFRTKNKRNNVPAIICLRAAKKIGCMPAKPIFETTHVVPQMMEVRNNAK